MRCIICNSQMVLYFCKKFQTYGIGSVEYYRCPKCEFVASRTHYEMAQRKWETLNSRFHRDSIAMENNPNNNPPPYFKQALMMYLVKIHCLLPNGPWLDWGAGRGRLSVQLSNHFDLKIVNYDKYFHDNTNKVRQKAIRRRAYSLVVNSAVFEHVRDRETLDEIESYVSEEGCLAVHTHVSGIVPKDEKWFYLLPVHCSFHTNKSMQKLMKDWGYRCSVYNEEAKLWLLFRDQPVKVEAKVKAINQAMGFNYLHYKNGFMDYWK